MKGVQLLLIHLPMIDMWYHHFADIRILKNNHQNCLENLLENLLEFYGIGVIKG